MAEQATACAPAGAPDALKPPDALRPAPAAAAKGDAPADEARKGDFEEEIDIEAALDRAGYGLYNRALLLTGVLSALSHQGQSSMLSYLLPAAECDLELSALRKGLLAATPYAGMLCSALLWGFLSDTVGRRRLLVVAYALDGAMNVLSSLAQHFWFLLVTRFVGGIIISGPMSIQKTFLSEFHGAASRSRVMMWTGVFVACANVSYPLLAWAVLPLPFAWAPAPGTAFVFNSWRLFVALSSLAGFGASLLLSAFPESPKYLLSRGRREDALRVLRAMYRWNSGDNPDNFPVRRLRMEERAAPTPAGEEGAIGGGQPFGGGLGGGGGGGSPKRSALQVVRVGLRQVRPLFLRPHRRHLILVFCIQFTAMLGMNTLRLWVPQLFSSMEEYNLHHSRVGAGADASLCDILAAVRHPELRAAAQAAAQAAPGDAALCTVALLEDSVYIRAGIVGAATGIAFLTATFTIRFTGKRCLMMTAFVVGGAACMAMHWARSDLDTLALSSAYLALVGVSHTVAIAVAVDLFPTSLRNMAVSITFMAGSLGTVLGNVAFPVFLELNCVAVFFVLGAFPLCCSCLCLFLPNTDTVKNNEVL